MICGSINQTTQMHAIAKHLPDHYRLAFTPYYGAPHSKIPRKLNLLEPTIGGNKLRGICLDYLREHDLPVDLDGANAPYDLVFTCSDLLVPWHHYRTPMILVQEGMMDAPNIAFPWVRRFPHLLPRWIATTSATGLSDLYQRFCVASVGFKELFTERGVKPEKMVVTGMPNFDNSARFQNAPFQYKNYVLVCTSDTRETWGRENRYETIQRAKAIAGGRLLVFKLHPGEKRRRALSEIRRWAPEAVVFTEGQVEPMIANCDALVTKFSSTVFVGLALGKEVHSDFSLDQLKRLLPLQNGGRSGARIAEVACELMGDEVPTRTQQEARRAIELSAELAA